MNLTLQQLVEAYCESPAESLRNAIITKSVPLVRSIVGKISRPTDNPLAEMDDLQSVGIMGLLQALDSYTPDKNVQFNTFAYYRIRGSIIDFLRKIDQMPRQQRSLYGKAQQVIDRLTQEYGREPQDEEVAMRMEISMVEYHELLVNVQQRSALSLDDTRFSDNSADDLHSVIPDASSEQPDAALEEESTLSRVQNELKKFKDRDRAILALYYYEELTLAEIALTMGLTEARISQIIGKIMLQLRGIVHKEPARR